MRKVIKTEAIVLKKKELLNKDILFTLFSSDVGKLKALAKGVKTISSKRMPHLQTSNLIDVLIYKKGQSLYIQETQLKSAFSQIKNDSKKLSYIYFIFYIVEKLLPEEQKERSIYESLKKILVEISNSKEVSVSHLETWVSNILKKMGYIDRKKNLEEINTLIRELTNEKPPFFVI